MMEYQTLNLLLRDTLNSVPTPVLLVYKRIKKLLRMFLFFLNMFMFLRINMTYPYTLKFRKCPLSLICSADGTYIIPGGGGGGG